MKAKFSLLIYNKAIGYNTVLYSIHIYMTSKSKIYNACN